jgi:NAD(P)-dependent dehydrogenase (short-subunit alcohol dehydrogenase family)
MEGICVITGGGSGLGLETARVMGGRYQVIIVDISKDRLAAAVQALGRQGVPAEARDCDVTDAASVKRLAEYAGKKGKVKAVIHAAGISPHMGGPEKILKVNAVGTVNINNAFYEVMEAGSCLIDVASMAAYLAPGFIFPKRTYPLCRGDMNKFYKKMMRRINLFPKKQRSGLAYCISKNFVVWLAKKDADRFGKKGIRIISVSPGNFETPMGEIERKEAEPMLAQCAIKRYGKPGEIAHLFAMCADERLGYLTGTDILVDGGLVASRLKP